MARESVPRCRGRMKGEGVCLSWAWGCMSLATCLWRGCDLRDDAGLVVSSGRASGLLTRSCCTCGGRSFAGCGCSSGTSGRQNRSFDVSGQFRAGVRHRLECYRDDPGGPSIRSVADAI